MKADNRKWLLVYAFIMLLQILVILYWGSVKVNYHIDELYSMGYASSVTGKPWNSQYITTGQDFRFLEWVENAKYKEYILVSEEEQMFCEPPLKVARLFLTWKNYMAFLNVAESIAGYDFVSSRPALALNIVFFVLAELSLLLLMKKLSMDERVQALALSMFGFSCYVLSMVEYIRFYILVTLLLIVTLNFMYRLWDAKTWKSIIKSGLTIALFAYLSLKNSELSAVFYGALFMLFLASSLIEKKWKHVLFGMTIAVIAVVYVTLKTPYIAVLLHPELADSMGEVMREARTNLFSASFSSILDYLIWARSLFETYFFACRWILYLLLGAITICLVLHAEKSGKRLSDGSLQRIVEIRLGTACAMVGWLILLLPARGSASSVLISLLVLVVVVFLAFSEASGEKMRFWHQSRSSNVAYMGILCGTVLFYTAFCAMCGYNGEWRYYCFGFISITIILWYLVDRALKASRIREAARPLLWILAVFVIVNACLPFITRNIENMYEDERDFITRVEEHNSQDVVLFVTVGNEDDKWSISRHDLYDCVNLMSAGSMIYAVNLDQYAYEQVDYPEEFMLWSHVNNDLSIVMEDLGEHGYTLEDLGTDHCSRVFYCRLG